MLNSAIIFVDSNPILPPVVTEERRKWIEYYKQKAVQIELELRDRSKQPGMIIGVLAPDSCQSCVESRDSSVLEDENDSSVQTNGCEFPTIIINDSSRRDLNFEVTNSSVTNNVPDDNALTPDLDTTGLSQGTDTYSDAHTVSTDLNNYLHEMVEYSSSTEDKTLVPSSGLSENSQAEEKQSFNLTRSLSFTLDEPSPMLVEYMKRYGMEIADVKKCDQFVQDHDTSEDEPVHNTSTPREPCTSVHQSVYNDLCTLTTKLNNYSLLEGLPNIPSKTTNKLKEKVTKRFDEFHPKFCKISAAVKGYLTRRLLRTEKVQIIMKTIKDTLIFSQQLVVEAQSCDHYEDLELYQRIISQLDGAILQFHDIFFKYSIPEQMSLISNDRLLIQERALRFNDKLKEPKIQKSSPPKKSSNSIRASTCKILDRKRNHSKRKVSGRLSSRSPYAQKLLPPKLASSKPAGRSSSLF